MDKLMNFFQSKSDIALLLLRIVLGSILLVSGLSKVPDGFAIAAFASMGIPLPSIMAPFVTLLEIIGGVCLILGLFTRFVSLLFAIQFVVIILYVQLYVFKLGFSSLDIKSNLNIITSLLVLLTVGGGGISVNRWLGLDKYLS